MTDARDPDPPPAGPQSHAAGGSGKKALGRGLGALIGDSRAALGRTGGAGGGLEGRLRELAVADITVNRRQPRRAFSDDELQELATSIKALGVVQPVVVRPLQPDAAPAGRGESPPAPGARFELIAGERRLRAAKIAGLERIPALIRPADEMGSLEIALAENVARSDLNAIEEAQAYAALVDEFGLTHERISELVGRSRVAVTNLLRLLDLPDDVQEMIELGELSEGHGRALLGLPDHAERRRVARLALAQGLTVRQVEALVKQLLEGGPQSATPPARPTAGPDYTELADELYGVLEAPVRIRGGKRGGAIQIAFKDRAGLERLIALLRTVGS